MDICTVGSYASLRVEQCETIEAQVAELKELLTKFIPAMVSKIGGGGIINYTINTGQTVQTVRVEDMKSLISDYRNILSLYNELIQYLSGSGFVAIRDESAGWVSCYGVVL